MNMSEAKTKLMEMVNGEYHCIEYKLDDHGGGHVSQTCKVYVHGQGSFEAAHWEDALSQLKAALGGRPPISEDIPTSKPSEPKTA